MPSNSSNTTEEDPILEEYLSTLTPKEIQGYNIAKSHLGMTYQYDKTIGFIEWQKKKQETTQNTN